MIIEYSGGAIHPNCLAYFYASWSSKCNLHLDALKKIESENKDLTILRVNVSKFHSLKEKYAIHKIPTFIFFKDETIISRINGYSDQYSLIRWIKKIRS